MQRSVVRNRSSIHLVLILLGSLSLIACGNNKPKTEAGDAQALYERAAKSLGSGNYQSAIQALEFLSARYPFSSHTKQAQLDLMYSYFKSRQSESAVDAADQFIRENPTHPRIDYAYYIKGLVYFEQGPGMLERLFRVDMSARPPRDAEKAFENFSIIVRRFPSSKYVPDARQRMVYLRNRLAQYEVHVAKYYMKRGMYVAAANRSKYVVERYEGAPATRDALKTMADAYRELGVDDLAGDAERVLTQNYPNF